MDIGTKKEPGRELDVDEARNVNGGHTAPDIDDPPQDDPFGTAGNPVPVDYSNP